MNPQIQKIQIFNQKLDKLFNYLIDTFPSYKGDVILSKTAAQLISKGNPRLVLQQFTSFVMPYKTQILNCNETFFLNFDKNCNVPVQHLMNGLKLKNIWLQASQRDKAKLWLYFRDLIRIAEM